MTNVDDKLKGLASKLKVPLKALFSRSEDPTINRGRLLAARFLYLRFERDSGRVATRLNCSTSHVTLANKLAERPDEDGDAFRKELDELGLEEKPAQEAESVEEPDPASDTNVHDEQLDKDPNATDLLFKMAKERYGLEPKDVCGAQGRSAKVFEARRMFVILANRVFLMTNAQIADALTCKTDTVNRILKEADGDYGIVSSFTDDVDEESAKFGVMPKKTKAA